MKPILVVVKENNKKIELTPVELKNMLDKAYEQGYNDGANENRIVISNAPHTPTPQVFYDSSGNPYQYCATPTI